MSDLMRIETALGCALRLAQAGEAPPTLQTAMRYAVFPGGARVRPRLSLAVARACVEDEPELSAAAAAAVELLHCASLVHDDLPCFDDASMRRGRPSVHRAFGQPIAVLVGDALIVLAFQSILQPVQSRLARATNLLSVLMRSAGSPVGIAAGQAWESESKVQLEAYQRAKTGALFAAAAAAGACAAGHDPQRWAMLGERIGAAYQIADDLRDEFGSERELGKPAGKDRALGRPNAVHALGVNGALARVQELTCEALDSIPECEGRAELRSYLLAEARRLLPREVQRPAA